MADSLDDFFAKKDKKRGKDKGKNSVFSAESLVKELEEGSKHVDYPVRKDNKTSTAIELLGLDADDADWRDFEDVEKRDYTGLKLKEMSLQDQNDEEQRRLISEQADPLPESTPWKIKDEASSSSATVESTSNAKQKAADEKSTTSIIKSDAKQVSSSTDQNGEQAAGKSVQISSDPPEVKSDKPSAKSVYVPRAQLEAERALNLAPVRLNTLRNQNTRHGHTPNIQDEQAFPSLG